MAIKSLNIWTLWIDLVTNLHYITSVRCSQIFVFLVVATDIFQLIFFKYITQQGWCTVQIFGGAEAYERSKYSEQPQAWISTLKIVEDGYQPVPPALHNNTDPNISHQTNVFFSIWNFLSSLYNKLEASWKDQEIFFIFLTNSVWQMNYRTIANKWHSRSLAAPKNTC